MGSISRDDWVNGIATVPAELVSGTDLIPYSIGGHPSIQTVRAILTSGASNQVLVTASGAQRLLVTRIRISSANAVNGDPAIIIGFGTASVPSTTKVVYSHPGIPSGFLDKDGDGSGAIGIGALDEDLRASCGSYTGGNVEAVISYAVLS